MIMDSLTTIPSTHMTARKDGRIPALLTLVMCFLAWETNGQAAAQLTINASQPLGAIDLTRFSLGQGGLSPKPMFDAQLNELKAIKPATIRIFLQEYYNLLPALNTYHWSCLDSTLDVIKAIGARPILDVCFKPKVLYPTINQSVMIPNSWAAWDTLVSRLVTHCLQKNYGVQYWEIGNEPDIGEQGGCPYLATTPGDYLQWYTHTSKAIKAADPSAKVGGAAEARCCPYGQSTGMVLLEHCAAGNAPLDFFSWHAYGGGGGNTSYIKSLLSTQFPSLSNIETLITEWNSSIDPAMDSSQPAFCLETMRQYASEGLTIAAYYHIRDYVVDPKDFAGWFSNPQYMADFWNGRTLRGGMFGFNGEMRPIYYVFLWLGRMKGTQVASTCGSGDIRSWAVKSGTSTYAIFWNYGGGTSYNVTLSLPGTQSGNFQLKKLNFSAVKDDLIRSGTVQGLTSSPLTVTLARYDIAWLEISDTSTVLTPTFSPAPGRYTSAQSVTISCETPGATIRYTTDGSDPDTTSAVYRAPIQVTARTTIKARGFKSGMANGNIAMATYQIAAPGSDWTLFTTQTPVLSDVSNDPNIELGVKFTTNSAGAIGAIRYLKPVNETGTHTGSVWSATGTLLATATFANETGSGWQETALANPLSISAGTVYVVSVNANAHYVATNNGLSTSIVNGPLSTVADGANGVYGGVGAFPTRSYQNSNYFRDVVVLSEAAAAGRAFVTTRSMARTGAAIFFDLRGRRVAAAAAHVKRTDAVARCLLLAVPVDRGSRDAKPVVILR
jgi:hypothetical protein